MPHDTGSEDAHQTTTEITIDQEHFRVSAKEMTGSELRTLPDPDIGPERDLYLEGHHGRDDELVGAGDVVKIKHGLRFFTAPSSITPGHAS